MEEVTGAIAKETAARAPLWRRWERRVASERGSVGVVVALVLFAALGMLTMAWNTAQISKAKMRLQNAADSAALAHAIWQARGMNTVQNINDEMYEALSLCVRMAAVAEVSSITATGLLTAGMAFTVFPILGLPLIVAGVSLYYEAVFVEGAAGWLGQGICGAFLDTLALVYAKGSGMMGVWNAQQLAYQNEADPLAQLTDGFGLYTVGMSSEAYDMYVLPLAASSESGNLPWSFGVTSVVTRLLEKIGAFRLKWVAEKIGTLLNSLTGLTGWSVTPMVSKRGDLEGLVKENGVVTDDSVLPTPTVWVACKLGNHIQTLPLDGFWNPKDSERWQHAQPMYAIAAAQCITGDVVAHSAKGGPRPRGFGTGATAKLVPVAEVFHRMKNGNGPAVESIIYH